MRHIITVTPRIAEALVSTFPSTLPHITPVGTADPAISIFGLIAPNISRRSLREAKDRKHIAPQKVICLWPHSLQAYFPRLCPGSVETRLGAPHLLHLTSIRVLPCVICTFRAIASFTKRSDSSRIACFDIAGARSFFT
jgi:hypothetical protein